MWLPGRILRHDIISNCGLLWIAWCRNPRPQPYVPSPFSLFPLRPLHSAHPPPPDLQPRTLIRLPRRGVVHLTQQRQCRHTRPLALACSCSFLRLQWAAGYRQRRQHVSPPARHHQAPRRHLLRRQRPLRTPPMSPPSTLVISRALPSCSLAIAAFALNCATCATPSPPVSPPALENSCLSCSS